MMEPSRGRVGLASVLPLLCAQLLWATSVAAQPGNGSSGSCLADLAAWNPICDAVAATCSACAQCLGADATKLPNISVTDTSGGTCGGCWEEGQITLYTCADFEAADLCSRQCPEQCLGCFGLDTEMLPTKDVARLGILDSDVTTGSCVPMQVEDADYGNVEWGCCGWAGIVAVYATATRWPQVQAWAPAGAAVGSLSVEACRSLCAAASPGCEAWTLREWQDSEQECLLKRAVDCVPSTCSSPMNSSAAPVVVSGPADCASAWKGLDPAPSEEPLNENLTCALENRAFGLREAGACADAEVLEVHGPREALIFGVERRWWLAFDAYEWKGAEGLEPAALAEGCQARCQQLQECYASNAFASGDLAGVCMLMGELSCSPATVSFRGSIALKSQGCFSLSTDDGAGQAHPVPCGAGRCRDVHTKGSFVRDDFAPLRPEGEECYMHSWQPEELVTPAGAGCLAERWIVFSGGSNVFAQASVVANFFSGQSLFSSAEGAWCCPFPTFELFPFKGHDIIDLVFDANLQPIYYNTTDVGAQATGEVVGGEAAARGFLDRAPGAPGGLRITLTAATYWPMLLPLVKAVNGTAGPWSLTQRIYFSQVSQWYRICVYGPCPRPELMGLREDQAQAAFRADMQQALDDGIEEICNGPLTTACFFATNMWGGLDQAVALGPYNDHLKDEVQQRSGDSGKLRIIDVYEFTAQILSEVHGAHTSPKVYLWIWQLVLNSVCSGEGDVGTGPDGCPATVTFEDQCLWETMTGVCGPDFNCRAAIPCSFDRALTTDAGSSQENETWSNSTCGPPNLAEVLGTMNAQRKPVASVAAPVGVVDPCGRRLGKDWCDDDLQWVCIAFGILTTLSFILYRAFAASHRCSRKEEPTASSIANVAAAAVDAEGAPATGPTDFQQLASEGAARSPAEAASGTSPGATAASGTLPGTPGTTINSVTPALGAAGSGTGKKEWLYAIGAARLLASLHIVVGHMQNAGHVAWPQESSVTRDLSYMFSWGFTWVPWFFMLSGYVLTHARLASGKPKPVLRFCSERLSSIYPVYAVGLLLSLLLRIRRDAEAMPWLGQVLQPWLLHAWVPPYAEVSLQAHCWFLSCLVPYWLLFEALFTALSRLGTKGCCALLLALASIPWITMVLIPAALPDTTQYWYNDGEDDPSWSKGIENPWDYEFPEHAEDFWVTFLKFHPLCYFHIFAFGALLAQLRDRVKGSAVYRRLAMFAAEVGYVGLLLVFLAEPIFAPEDAATVFRKSTKLSARLSVLMPLQGMVLLGLSNSGGPLSRIFSAEFVVELGEIGYSQYVLQFICWGVWPTVDGSISLGFFIFLFGCSVCMYYAVHKPCQKCWRATRWQRLLWLPLALTALLLAASLVMRQEQDDGQTVQSVELQPLAGDVVYEDSPWGLYDRTLDLATSTQLVGFDGQPALINPTVAVTSTGMLVLAIRRHAQSEERGVTEYLGRSVTEIRHIYHSDIIAGEVAWQGTFNDSVRALGSLAAVNFVSQQGEEGVEWGSLCPDNGVYIPENNTLVRKYVTGPEDPRLVIYQGGAMLSFYSMPLPAPSCPAIPVTKVFLSPEPLAPFCDAADDTPRAEGQGCRRSECPEGFGFAGGELCLAGGRNATSRSGHREFCQGLAPGAGLLDYANDWDAKSAQHPDLASAVLNGVCGGSVNVPVRFEEAVCASTADCPGHCEFGCGEGMCWSTQYDTSLCFGKADGTFLPDGSLCAGGMAIFPCASKENLYKCPDFRPDAGRGVCFLDKDGNGTMATAWSDPRPVVEFQCSERADKSEKNWIGFSHEGRLHWVYQVLPHVVAEVRPEDGSCFQVGRTDYAPLTELTLGLVGSGLKVHGSGSAVPWSCCGAAAAAAEGGGPGCFLAVFHLLNATDQGRIYTHFFYKFEAGGDFAILEAARHPLPLVEVEPSPGTEPFAFVSGLATSGGEVIVSYGSGDRQARALVMSTEQVENYFDCHL